MPTEYRGYRYHIFRAPGTLTVTTPGMAEAVAVPGGGGGGSGAGGGGGGGVPVRTPKPFVIDANLDVTPGEGGLGGTAGGDGERGGDSLLGDLLRARGGGGGAGKGLPAQSSPISGGGGGGGKADEPTAGGTPDACSATIGGAQPGGSGHGYDSGGAVAYGGGGGGARGRGQSGATQEVVGNPLSANWTPNGADWSIDVAGQRLLFSGGASIAHNDVSRGEMLVQGTLFPQVSIPPSGSNFIHLMARLSPGDNLGFGIGFTRGAVGTDLAARIFSRTTTGGLSSSIGTIDSGPVPVQDYDVELYVADGVQQGWIDGLGKVAAANTDHNGQNARSAGFYNDSDSVSEADNFRVYPTKYVTVAGLNAGETVRVLDEDGVVVGAPGAEAGGTAQTSISNYDANRKMPAGGYRAVQVLDAGLDVVAEYAEGGVFPGAEMTRAGAAITIDTDGDDLLDGLVALDDFNGVTPGPEHGDGGGGVDLHDFFLNGHVVEVVSSGARLTWDAAGDDGADVDVVREVRPGSVAAAVRIRVIARQNPTASLHSGYGIELRGNGSIISEFRLVRWIDGAFQQFGSTAAISFGLTDNLRIRLQCVGTTFRGKIWKYGDGQPGAWLRSGTDDTHDAGRVMMFDNELGHQTSYMAVNKAGGAAPDPEQVATDDDIRTFFEDQVPGEHLAGWTPVGGSATSFLVVPWPQTTMITPVVAGDAGFFGGGGGAGSESVIAGKGGRGGGGDGSLTGAGSNGLDDTGGGGGGSATTATAGGRGGNGVVVVRTELVA